MKKRFIFVTLIMLTMLMIPNVSARTCKKWDTICQDPTCNHTQRGECLEWDDEVGTSTESNKTSTGATSTGTASINELSGCAAVLPGVDIDPKIPNTVHNIIMIIQIIVPVLLVVFGMMDLVKAVMGQKEDEIKKGQQTLIKRVIAAAIVFFVIAIVKLVISFVSDNNGGIMNCANCFLNGVNSSGECK